MESLLSNEWYCKHIKGKQECMIGYSDSGKDAGRLAAAWGLYEVQVLCPPGGCHIVFATFCATFCCLCYLGQDDSGLILWPL